MKLNPISYFSKKIGLTDMLLVLPEFKNKIFFFVFISLAVSVIDLIGIGFIGFFVIIFLKNDINDFEFLNILFPNLKIDELIYILVFFLLLIYLIKGILSYSIHKKIIYYCYEQQNSLRKKYLELFFFDFYTMKGKSFENQISTVIEFIKKVTENYLSHLLKIISDLVIIVIIFCFLFIKDPFSTTLLLLLFILTFLIYKFLYKDKIDKLGIESRNYIQILIKKTNFLFQAFKEIKLFGKEVEFTEDIIETSNNNTNSIKKFASLLVLPKYYSEFIFISFLLFISIGAILKYGNTDLAYAQIGIYGAAIARIAPMMNSLLQSITTIWNNKATLDEIKNFFFVKNLEKLKAPKAFSKSNQNNLTELHIENLSFSYSDKKIFDNMSLEFKINSLIGLYGPSGTGKSTFVNLLTGFLRQNEGNIYLKDIHNNKFSEDIYKSMGIIPQEIRLMDETIAKNVSLEIHNKKIDNNKLIDALKNADAFDFISKLPDGINTKLENFGLNLSGGQRQRIAIARVLYRNSKILILDEPFSSLDESSELKLLNLLQKLKKDRIIFIVTHKKSILNKFDISLLKKNMKFVNLN